MPEVVSAATLDEAFCASWTSTTVHKEGGKSANK